jgi:hypothetical protein
MCCTAYINSNDGKHVPYHHRLLRALAIVDLTPEAWHALVDIKWARNSYAHPKVGRERFEHVATELREAFTLNKPFATAALENIVTVAKAICLD